jgi:hypothetical protein
MAANRIADKFSGFYFHGNGGKPLHAIVCNKYYTTLSNWLKAQPTVIDLNTTRDNTDAYENARFIMHQLITRGRFNSLQSDSIYTKWQNTESTTGTAHIPLHLPITVRVVGPSPNSAPTLCAVGRYVCKSAIYCIVESKVISAIITGLIELCSVEESIINVVPTSLYGVIKLDPTKAKFKEWTTLETVLTAYYDLLPERSPPPPSPRQPL